MNRRHDRTASRSLIGLVLAGAILAACNKKSDEAGSAKAAGPSFALTVQAPSPGAAGGAFAPTVRVVPRGIYKINLEYPTRLQIKAPAAATPREVKLVARNAAQHDEKGIVFRPSFKIASAGDHAFQGTLRFSVCTPKQCELKSEKIQWVAKATR